MTEPEHLETRHLLGLDIGQAKDPTALVRVDRFLLATEVEVPAHVKRVREEGAFSVIEREVKVPARREIKHRAHYEVRQIERFQLGGSYGSYENRAVEMCRKAPVGKLTLVVDHTGVGRRVFEALQEKLRGIVSPTAVTITAGAKVHYEDGVYNVPKRDLVGVVQVLLGEERLKIAQEETLSSVLVKELQNFRIKITDKRNDTYEAWREGDHDDLVLATALACWWGENYGPVAPVVPEKTPSNPFAMKVRT